MKRPVGLVILAVSNFIFATGRLVGFVLVLAFPDLLTNNGFEFTRYDYIFTAFSAAVLIVSGIGFLMMNVFWGFIGGLIFAFFELVIYCLYNFTHVFGDVSERPETYLIYPVLLLYALLIRYRKIFFKGEEPTPARYGLSDGHEE